ncbi:MAG: lipid-transfer protein, partial [Actinomycetota bacterium]
MLKDRTAIVGIGQTPFAKHLEPSEKQLACEAIVAALDDAGIDPSEVDAFASYTMEETEEVEVAKSIGAGDVTFFSKVGYGGGGGCATVGHLAMAIATGQATVGVAWRSRKRGSGKRPWTDTVRQLPTPAQWSRPWGLLRPVDEIAMLTRRYMHEYGATRDHLANVAVAVRNHANRNPNAVMYERPLTREDYMAARWISEPLCLFDNCLETDGALACVVVSAERAADSPHPPAFIHSFAQGLPAQHQTMVNYWT